MNRTNYYKFRYYKKKNQNNENNQNNEDSKPINTGDITKNTQLETSSDLKCKWCKKQFKRKSPKIKHETQQLCIPRIKRTICLVCNIKFNTPNEYKTHLTSKEHIKTLIKEDTDNDAIQFIKTDEVTSIDVDPFLSRSDKLEFSTLGNNLTFTENHSLNDELSTYKGFMNTTKNKLNLDEETELEVEIRNEKEQANYLNEISSRNNLRAKGYSSYEELIREEIYNRPMPNDKQEEILCQLVDLNDELSDDKRDAFLEILKNMTEDDADFMTTYIRDCGGINLESKQIYLELIDKFVRKLTQIYNQGYKKIGGKDIIIFISRLSK